MESWVVVGLDMESWVVVGLGMESWVVVGLNMESWTGRGGVVDRVEPSWKIDDWRRL
jgi:hypothetical protein